MQQPTKKIYTFEYKNYNFFKSLKMENKITNDSEAFDKIELIPGESKIVTFKITPKMLEFTGLKMEKTLEAGAYRVMMGTSSNEYLETTFKLVK